MKKTRDRLPATPRMYMYIKTKKRRGEERDEIGLCLFWLRFTGQAVAKKQEDRGRGMGMTRREGA